MERRLAAILAADVVGSGRLMGDDEEETLARLRDHSGLTNRRSRALAPRLGRQARNTSIRYMSQFVHTT